jgi:hypothetical protein
MYFDMKNYLKSTHNHTAKHHLTIFPPLLLPFIFLYVFLHSEKDLVVYLLFIFNMFFKYY